MMTNSLVHWPLVEGVEPDDLNDNGELADNELDASYTPLNDEVFRLRQWGAHRVFPLRAPAGRHKRIGSASVTALQISSRYFASDIGNLELDLELVCEGQSWRLKDLTGVAGLKQDGVSTREVALLAGTEVTVAGKTLIAETPHIVRLQAFCSRLLGWSNERIGIVDQALRAIRLASSGRAVLVLRGKGDMIPIAFAIHRHVLGREAPFVVSDTRRGNVPETVRSPANCKARRIRS